MRDTIFSKDISHISFRGKKYKKSMRKKLQCDHQTTPKNYVLRKEIELNDECLVK